MRLLVIEDNTKIADLIRRGLSENGYSVEVCTSGIEGERAGSSGLYDAIILDVGLPDRSGMEVCRNLRQQGVKTPLLMLTVLSSTTDKVRGLSVGADDYLTKPFEFEELEARLKALMRRSQGADTAHLKHEDLELDLIRRTATRGGRRINLTRKEFDLLELFLRNPRRVLSRSTIGTAVWDQNFATESNVIDVYVHTLRRKINSGASRMLIQTVIGFGYVLDAEPTDDGA